MPHHMKHCQCPKCRTRRYLRQRWLSQHDVPDTELDGTDFEIDVIRIGMERSASLTRDDACDQMPDPVCAFGLDRWQDRLIA